MTRLALAALLLLQGCAYAVGSGPVCGGKLAHLSVYAVLRQQGLTLTCKDGESLTVGASSELAQLATLLGASMALALKAQGLPLRAAQGQNSATLDHLERRLDALEARQP